MSTLSTTTSTALDRARKQLSFAIDSVFGPYNQTEDQTAATLDTMRGWLEAESVDAEDLMFGIIGESVYQQIFPATSHCVVGSASLFAHYRKDIGKITADSLIYSLNPTNNQKATGDPSRSRLETWNRLTEAKRRQTSLIQTAGASMIHGMATAGSMYAPQSVFDKLTTATDPDLNRTIARDFLKLIKITLEEQDAWQDDEGRLDEKETEVGNIPE